MDVKKAILILSKKQFSYCD